MMIQNQQELRKTVDKTVQSARIVDVHTHLYPPSFGDILLWGIDELLTYHYLVAETFRWTDISYQSFWSMSKVRQADLIWKTLFLENSPYSEACRGVLAVLQKLGLDVSKRSLEEYRSYFAGKTVEEYVDIVFDLARIDSVVMTNDPFDDLERPSWLENGNQDSRFKAALRLDGLLNDWERNYKRLIDWGYQVEEDLNSNTVTEIRRFLTDWTERMKAMYMAVSLPPDFAFPEESARARIIEECVLPVCRDFNIPFAMMVGVKKLTNPELLLAGDSVGKSDICVVEYLCSHYPGNKFMVTMLARENQHELAVAARKFRNLMVFGCWWFLNNPSLVEEMTRMRFELLGVSVIPQHSDARVLDQLIYKWEHSRKIIADVLYDKYKDLMDTGWSLSEREIQRDVEKLFRGNFTDFISRKMSKE
ncbi:MAG: glucuronate isomerase [Clostridia bacterium]|jgi:hypothetical protein